MKANGAPEKIYIQPNAQDGWFMVNNLNNTFVEYTRTDTFIEKAARWIYDNAYLYVDGQIGIKDFKKYIKGE